MIGLEFTDGTTTIALNNNWQVVQFELTTPAAKSADVEDPVTAGGERFQMAWQNIDQIIEIIYTGDVDEFRTQVRALEIMLARAAERQGNPGLPKMYLHCMVRPADGWWRSEVIHGRIEYDANVLHYPWPKRPIHFFIGVRRRYYWEALELTQLSLSTVGVAKTSSPITMYNHTDDHGGGVTQSNYVDIDAGDVLGSLVTPATITLTVTAAGDRLGFDYFWFARNVNASPTVFNHMIEGESADPSYKTQVPGSADFVNYSGGYGNQRTIPAVEGIISKWTLSTAQLAAAKSQFFHVLTRLATYPSLAQRPYTFLRLKFLLSTIWEGPKIFWPTTHNIQDLGIIQLPPWIYTIGDPSPLYLELVGACATGGTQSITIDYLSLMPTDSWLRLDQQGYFLETGDQVIYDGDSDRIQGFDASENRNYNIWSRQGMPFMLHPGQAQRLYLHMNTNTGSSPLTGTLTIQVHYRPRKLAL